MFYPSLDKQGPSSTASTSSPMPLMACCPSSAAWGGAGQAPEWAGLHTLEPSALGGCNVAILQTIALRVLRSPTIAHNSKSRENEATNICSNVMKLASVFSAFGTFEISFTRRHTYNVENHPSDDVPIHHCRRPPKQTRRKGKRREQARRVAPGAAADFRRHPSPDKPLQDQKPFPEKSLSGLPRNDEERHPLLFLRHLCKVDWSTDQNPRLMK